MKNTFLARTLGFWAGLMVSGAALPGVSVANWALFMLGAAVVTILYVAARLVTRALTLAFDIILFGLPRFFLEAALILWFFRLVPGATILGYWWAMAALLIGLCGMYIARRAVTTKA